MAGPIDDLLLLLSMLPPDWEPDSPGAYPRGVSGALDQWYGGGILGPPQGRGLGLSEPRRQPPPVRPPPLQTMDELQPPRMQPQPYFPEGPAYPASPLGLAFPIAPGAWPPERGRSPSGAPTTMEEPFWRGPEMRRDF